MAKRKKRICEPRTGEDYTLLDIEPLNDFARIGFAFKIRRSQDVDYAVVLFTKRRRKSKGEETLIIPLDGKYDTDDLQRALLRWAWGNYPEIEAEIAEAKFISMSRNEFQAKKTAEYYAEHPPKPEKKIKLPTMKDFDLT